MRLPSRGGSRREMNLDEIFDGWVHYLEPAKDFEVPGAIVCEHIEIIEEDDDLDPYESGTPYPNWVAKPGLYPEGKEPEGRAEEAAWAGLAMALTSLSKIIGGTCKAYQENTYDDRHNVTRRYSFQFIPGESGYKEGRL